MIQDVVTWGTLIAAVSLAVGLVRLRSESVEKMSKAEQAIDAIETNVTELKRAAAELHNRITMSDAGMGLYREQAAKDAREYITRDMMREVEGRLVESMREMKKELGDDMKALTQRIDRVLQPQDHQIGGRR